MYSRAQANEHFLIKRPYDDKSQRVPFTKEIDQFFKLLADKKHHNDQIATQLPLVLACLRSDPNSIQAAARQTLLVALCTERPELFLDLSIFNILIDALRKEYTSSFKTKANPAFCFLSAQLLTAAFKDIDRLPLEIVQVVCDDWAYDALWIEGSGTEVRSFAFEILSFFIPFLSSDSHSSTAPIQFNFSSEKLLEIKLYITGSIQSFGDVGNYRSLKAAQRSSLFRFVSLGCKYEDVRRKCFNYLPDWCHNQHYERECHQVFLNFCYNLKFTPNSTPDFDSDCCAKIITGKNVREPADLLIKGIWFILHRNEQHNGQLLLSIFTCSPSTPLIQSVYSCLLVQLMKERDDFVRTFFSILHQNSERREIFNFLIDTSKCSTLLTPLIENVCLNFDKLNLAPSDGTGIFSRLIASLASPNFTLLGSVVNVFINGYLAYQYKQEPLSGEQLNGIIRVFRANSHMPILNSATIQSLWSNLNLLPLQYGQLCVVLLENTIRCMTQNNFTPQTESFGEEFVQWLLDLPFSQVKSEIILSKNIDNSQSINDNNELIEVVKDILLCICSIAPEIVGFFIWNKFPAMKTVICNAIYESSNNPTTSSVPYFKLLCRCRRPDFLMEFISDSQTTNESFDILGKLLQTNEHIIHSIPEMIAIDFVIYLTSTGKFPQIRKQLVQRMELYFVAFVSFLVQWIVGHDESFARVKGYRLLFDLCPIKAEFTFTNVLCYLKQNFPREFDQLAKWNLNNEMERNILYATLKTCDMSTMEIESIERREEIELTLQHFESTYTKSNDRIADVEMTNGNIPVVEPFKPFPSACHFTLLPCDEPLSEPGEIISDDHRPINPNNNRPINPNNNRLINPNNNRLISPNNNQSVNNVQSIHPSTIHQAVEQADTNTIISNTSSNSMHPSQSFADLLMAFFTTEPFNLSNYFSLLRYSYDNPSCLDEYFYVSLEMIQQKPHRLFKYLDIFSTSLCKMSPINHDFVAQLVKLGFSRCNTTVTLESTIRLCHNYCKSSYQSCIDLLKQIQLTHITPRLELSPTLLSPILESLQSQKPLVIYRESCFSENQQQAIKRTFQSLLECTHFSTLIFSAAQKCLEELLVLSQGYPEVLHEIAAQLVRLLFLNPLSNEQDQQMQAMIQAIRAKGYDLILRLLASNPDNLLLPVGFVDSLKFIRHDDGFIDKMIILCPEFRSDIRLKQLHQTL